MSPTTGQSQPRAGTKISRTIETHQPAVVLAAAVAPLAACAALSTVRSSVTATTAVLLLTLLVVAGASTGLRLAGLAAAFSSGIWFDFFLTAPYHQFAIYSRANLDAALLMVVIGMAVTEVALWGHRQQARATRRAGYLDGVLGTAEIVAMRTEEPDALAAHVADQIKQILVVGRCQFVRGLIADPQLPILNHDGGVTRRGKTIDVDRFGLPTDDHMALVVRCAGVEIGHFLVSSSAAVARPTLEERKVAILLADQAGRVLADSP